MILQLGIWMSFKTYILSFTIAKTLKPDEKLTAKNNPQGCIETDNGYSLNTWEINPFF